MIQAQIAGLSVQVVGGDQTFFPVRLKEYEKAADKPDLLISMSRLDKLDIPEGEEILRRNGLRLLKMPNGDICRYTVGNMTGAVVQVCRSSADYASFEYTLLSSRTHPHLSLTDFEYVYSGEAFANRLAYLGGLVMHGSAISYEGNGIVFSAPSGTGKSTHAGLWKKYYGDSVLHINDDKPAIRFDGGSPTLYGTPWSGKTDTNANISAPLKAIVFLEQAPKNRIQSLSVSDAMFRIHRETVRPFYDADLGMKVLETTERLIQSVPVYLLECTISQEAVELVKQVMNW